VEQLSEAFTEAGMKESDFDRYTRLKEIERNIAAGSLTGGLRWT